MKKWGVATVVVLIVALLYYIELGRIDRSTMIETTALDHLKVDEAAKEWSPFYRVRVTIIDGQTAGFAIPTGLKEKIGKKLKLTGAAVFYDSACSETDDGKIAVSGFFLLPSLGLAEACAIQPSVSMRWTVLVSLAEEWLVGRDDMIKTEVEVEGVFRIDTGKPYDAAFFLDGATVRLIQK